MLFAVATNGGGNQAFCYVHYDALGSGAFWLYDDVAAFSRVDARSVGGKRLIVVAPGGTTYSMIERAIEILTEEVKKLRSCVSSSRMLYWAELRGRTSGSDETRQQTQPGLP